MAADARSRTRAVFENDARLLLTVLDKGQDTLLVLDSNTGSETYRVDTKSSVSAAYVTRRGLVWCQSDAVFAMKRP